jgi:hypothetical protein
MIPYQIGTTQAGMVGLETLGVDIPRATPVDYSEYVNNGAGEEIPQGWLECEWRWDGITPAQIATLRAYCPGTVYIRTLAEDGNYAAYLGYATTPRPRLPKAGLVVDFVIQFRRLGAL